MAGLDGQRGLCLALLLCLGCGAGALRLTPAEGEGADAWACSRLTSPNPFVRFPLDVEGLLLRFSNDKSKLFPYLKSLGVDNVTVKMYSPGKVSTACLGSAHFVFVGDCYARMTFEAFLRANGQGNMFKKELDDMDALEDAAASTGNLEMLHARRLDTLHGGSLANATYVYWVAQPPNDVITRKIKPAVDNIKRETPGAKIVIWMDAMVWGWFGGDRGWDDPGKRETYQIQVVKGIRSAFPDALLVWDSPTFIDMPMMGGWPPKGDRDVYMRNNAAHVPAKLAEQDRRVMANLGVPITLRWEVSNKYRGLQCDGLHALGHGAGAWNCSGFPAYEDLVLQSGLQQLCLNRKMHLCL